MKRGEIYYAKLDPTLGSEIAKRRPVLIVSNDRNNRASDTVTIIPITSNIEHVYPFEVFLAAGDSGLPKPSKAQAQQIRTISKQRLGSQPCGKIGTGLMAQIERAICLHLGM
jgi:mRNA interferase MazF